MTHTQLKGFIRFVMLILWATVLGSVESSVATGLMAMTGGCAAVAWFFQAMIEVSCKEDKFHD